jgi:integrin beta 3
MTLTFTKGERVRKFTIDLPIPIYRGTYNAREEYRRGDMVSFGGSIFIALCDNVNAKPEDDAMHWRLAVKRGRDGKDGKAGPQGERGLPGKDRL